MPVTSIDIPPEKFSTDVIIDIIDDGLAEGREIFTVTVRAFPVGHIFFARQDIVVEILDNEGMLGRSSKDVT